MRRRMLIVFMLLITGLLLIPSVISALSLQGSDGVWSNPIGTNSGAEITCGYVVNTGNPDDENRVTWGTQSIFGICPPSSDVSQQSGLGFEGNSQVQVEAGTVFVLGELTHYNNPLIAFNNLAQVELDIDLSFIAPNIDTSLDYTVLLDETTNNPNGPCPYGGPQPCADRVDMVSATENQEFTIDGVEYVLNIVGFAIGELGSCQYNPNNIVDGFISDEAQVSSACLFAQFLIAEPALEIVKTGSTGPVSPGDTVNYTITVSNIGDTTLTNVTVVDLMLNINTNLGSIEPGASVDIAGGYTVSSSDSPGPLVNIATADSDQTDAVQDSHSVNIQQFGSIDVVKLVDWAGMEQNQTVIFEICLTGPSYPNGDCQFADFDGSTLTWTNLRPGTYTIEEVFPGAQWAVEGNNQNVTVNAGQAETAYITNTMIPSGSLSVIKTVNWGETPVDPNASFSICATGPSYPTPACQSIGSGGGTLVWQNLIPGNYTVTEQPLPATWSVAGSGVTVTVTGGENSAIGITNTYIPPTVEQCEDPNPARDLVGNLLPETGYTTGRVVNNSTVCSYDIGIASYLMYDAIIDNQDIFDFNTTIIAPGQTLEIGVNLPACAVQVDLFHGAVLPSLNGFRYGPRLFDAVHLATDNYCVRDTVPQD